MVNMVFNVLSGFAGVIIADGFCIFLTVLLPLYPYATFILPSLHSLQFCFNCIVKSFSFMQKIECCPYYHFLQ